jgi:hypothetical protein
VRSSLHTRALFFSELRHTSIVVTCAYVDRTRWTSAYLRETNGPERIRNAIVDLVDCLPEHLVGGQKLLVDQHRGEKGFIRDLTRDLRGSQRLVGRASFAKVVARPDHGKDVGLIQIADMFAGEVRRRNGNWAWGQAGQLRIER